MNSVNFDLLENKKNILLTTILIIAVILGFLIRIKGLGKWPLTVDEYYMVKSIESILKHGLPRFKYGGYYDRGIIYQYLTAGLLLLGLKVEFAARFIPVITNILVVQPLYLLSKKVAGKTLAVTVAVVFCFSVWEVEFARFARMYSPFLLVFTWYMYFLYKNLIENDQKSLKWLFILSFISIFLYEASIFLALLNFFPFIWNHSRRTFDLSETRKIKKSFSKFVICTAVFLSAYFYNSFNFISLGTTGNNLPPDINYQVMGAGSGGKFRIPLILLSTLRANPIWFILFFFVIIISVYCFIKLYRKEELKLSPKLSFLFLIVLSFFNSFGLALFVFALFILINWISIDEFKRAINFFWSVY